MYKTFGRLIDLTLTSALLSNNDLTIKILPLFAAYNIAVFPKISVLLIYDIYLVLLNFFLKI